MTTSVLNRRCMLAAAAAFALTLAACGNGDDSQTDTGTDGGTDDGTTTTSVTVAEVQGVPSDFVAFGVEEGYFGDEGLDVQVNSGTGGAANIPQLVSGEAQFAGSNVVSVMLAVREGLDLLMVAPGTFGGDQLEHGYQNLMVIDDEITSVADLEGGSIAINTLQNIDHVLVLATLEAGGVDTATVELVEMPFPEMEAALVQGSVDAVRIIEPFAAIAEGGGARFLEGGTTASVQPELQIGSYVTTSEYESENPDVVAAFRAGLATTAERVMSDPQAFRDFLVETADMDQALADAMVLPDFSDAVHIESLETLGSLMVEYGFVDDVPEIDAFVLR